MNWIRLKVLLCGLLLSAQALAGMPPPVARALRASGLPLESASVFVQRVDMPKPLVSHRARQPVSPASTMKLVTTYAALELLGPAYVWRTEIYSPAPLRDGILDGDLFIKGYGDPTLTLESFWALLRTLRQSGVREINGDLVLDRSYFNEAPYDPGLFDGEPYRAYNAGPDALLVNFKATHFTFHVDAQKGGIDVAVDPELPQLRVDNRLQLQQMPCADWKERLGYRVEREAKGITVVFAGNYSLACGEKSLDLSLFDDADYVDHLFRKLWQEQGGIIHGTLRSGSVPKGARQLAQATSPPLAEVIRTVNKYSSNVMARQLLLTIDAEFGTGQGSTGGGAAAIRDWLAARKLDFPELVIDNGAGLSRNERISAAHMGELLLAAWRSPVMSELMSSLPVAAVDGTMKHRLNGSSVAERAHMKTGSLDGVRSIAGYLLDAKGQRWVVVFVVNHARATAAKGAQDALLQWLSDRN